MRKMFFAILVALLCLGGDLQNAWADGAILPLDAVTANVAVRYHHVTVNIQDQHAVTHVEQEFFNPNPTPVAGRYLFPIPPDAILSHFSATLDGQLQPA